MVRTLILNSTNITNSYNSQFTYNFPQTATFTDDYIGVQLISLYNSVFNITTTNNNNSFAYQWIDGTIINVNIPNSYFSLADINAYMQSIMFGNKHYLLSSTSQIVYLLELVVNQSRYAYQVNSYQIDTAIATANSWTLPSGATWTIPTPATNPIFIVPNTAFQQLIGFKAGNYPALQTGYSSTQSFLSTTPPQINPQPNYLCTCSLVNNRLALPSQLIISITPSNVAFGSLYSQQINDVAFNHIEKGSYNNFTFNFVDILGNPIIFQDPNILVLLIIKTGEELGLSNPSDTKLGNYAK